MLGNGALGYTAPLGQFAHGDFVGLDDALEHGPPGRIGKSAHDSIDSVGFIHKYTLAIANTLVNTNIRDHDC